MAHIVETQMDTPGAELRQRLDRAERQLPALSAGEVGQYLRSLDQLDQLMTSLVAEAADLRPEMTRWLDLQTRLGARSKQLVKLAAAEGGFPALRSANPPATGAWWRLDQFAAEQRKRSWTRAAATLAVIAIVLIAGAVVYQRWLAPSPEVVRVYNAINNIEQLALEGRWDEAAALVEQSLIDTPGDPDLLVWAGVLAERRGASEQAANYLAQGERAVGNTLRFQIMLGMRRLQAGDAEGAEAAALAAQAIDANEPQAAFLLGNVAEMRNQTQLALEQYQRTADLAQESDPQLTVIAKMRLGMLLQQLQYTGDSADEPPSPVPTPMPVP